MSSSNRKPYLTATTINQALLDACADNLTNQIELIVEIEAPDASIIRASDRNKYVGEHFYEALTNFPEVVRTIGDYLGQGLVFSEMTFELSNADGRYNKFLPGGADFAGWIGRSVTVKIGLRDVANSYQTIFNGTVTEEGGFARSVKSITIKARDALAKINKNFPPDQFTQSAYPKAVEEVWGTTIPLIYGDFTVNVKAGVSSIPATVINGGDIFVNGEQLPVTVTLSPDAFTPVVFTAVNHRLDVGDHITVATDGSLSSQLTGSQYVVSVTTNEFTVGPNGGPAKIVQTGGNTGNHYVTKQSGDALENVKLVISSNANTVFDTNQVWLLRSEMYYKVPIAVLENINANKNYFEIHQDIPAFQINGDKYNYNTSDKFFVRVKGKDLSGYNENIVAIAEDILKTYGGVVSGDLDSSWNYFKTKSTPSTSAVSTVKARAWIGEPQNAMEYAVSLLEQVRLELFFNRSQKLDLSSLHWDEFDDAPTFVVKNWDLEKDSFVPQIDDRNNFNRTRAAYSYLPDVGENAFSTKYYKNASAITQAGKEITKVLVYPNLHVESDVINQLTETMKLVSGYREIINCTLTSRAILKDIGDFLSLDVQIGSSVFSGVPCQIRDIGYSPSGLKLNLKLWSFAMLPFGAWDPGYEGIVGGESATITVE